MRKQKADFKSSLNNRAYNSLTIKVEDYDLEVTRKPTVYWNSGQGKRKLDSLILKGSGHLSVSLPNGNEIILYNSPEGLKVK